MRPSNTLTEPENQSRGPMHRALPWFSLLAGLATLALLATLQGCKAEQAQATTVPAPQVDVITVSTQTVQDWLHFTGHFEAVDSVQLRPRVSGYIDAVGFKEGGDVNRGDVLFVIDQRPYQLQLQRARAEVERTKAHLELARIDLARVEKLIRVKAVSKEEYDQRASRVSQFIAEHQASLAALEQAKLDLEYTQVVSPIDGRVSRAAVTRGNYVNAGDTILTTLVSLDPIYVSFETDESSFHAFQTLVRNGTLPGPESGQLPVLIGLGNDRNYPYAGQLTFIDNRLNQETGTIAVRALVANNQRQFTPGMLARVRLQASGDYEAALIDPAAIATDQDRKYVLVVNQEGVVEYRRVTLGSLHADQRVVRDGLQSGEQVVISGLQRVRPGMKVDANVIKADPPTAGDIAYRF